MHVCVYVCVHVHTSYCAHVEARERLLGACFLLLSWVLGIKVRSSGLYDRCHYWLSHLAVYPHLF